MSLRIFSVKGEKMKKGFSVISIVLVGALLLVQIDGSGMAYGASKVRSVPLKAGTLTGTLIDMTGKAIANATVKVIDRKGKVVAGSVTDKNGKVILKDIQAGDYKIDFGEKLSCRIAVREKAKLQKLSIVIPRRRPYSAGQLGGLTRTQWVWVIAGLVAVAIAVPIAIAANNGGGHRSAASGGTGGSVSP